MSFGTESRWPPAVRRILRPALGVAWALVAVAGLSELFLVGFAERRLTHSLEQTATAVSVRVAARPAVTLLAGSADDVVVRAGTMRARASGSGSGTRDLADLLARTGATARLDARIRTLISRRLTLHDVHLVKAGNRLTASATVTNHAIRAALPRNVRLSAAGRANAIALTATARVLGRQVNVRAIAAASGGRLAIAPKLHGLTVLTFTLFDDPRVRIDELRARATSDGYALEASGHLT